MRRCIHLLGTLGLAAALLAGCGDDAARPRADAAVTDAGVSDAEVAGDASLDGATNLLKACLERPTDLPRPPTTTLPCDLLPPTF